MPSVHKTVDDFATALQDHCDFPGHQIRKVMNPQDQAEMGDAVYRAAEEAEELLLVYYVGHGFVHSNGELYLATANSDRTPGLMTFKSTRYANVREIVQTSPAPAKIVILDCCFSGQAIDGLSASDTIDLAGIQGAYVITASSRNETALARDGEDHTAFSGELIRLLVEGDKSYGEYLSLRAIYHALRRRLSAKGYPQPRRRTLDLIDEMPFARNNSYLQLSQGSREIFAGTWTLSGYEDVMESLDLDLALVHLPTEAKAGLLDQCLCRAGQKVDEGEALFVVDRDISVRSPVEGTVLKVYRVEGDSLLPGDRLALIWVWEREADDSSLSAEARLEPQGSVPLPLSPAARPVCMPAVGAYAPDATIAEWLKYEGDIIECDEPLFEAENDIVSVVVPAPVSGVLVQIVAKENDRVDAGAVVAWVE